MAHVPFPSKGILQSQSAVLARHTFRLFFASGGRIAIQILLIPVLARIIAPEAFGLVAMAMPMLVFVSILAEAGLVTGLVRAQVGHDVESSAFWFSLGVGAASAVLVGILAFPISVAAGQPKLAPMLLALAPALPMTALAMVPSARLQRTGDFAAFGKVELIATAAAGVAALAAALAGWNAFSLVAQQLTLAAARLAGSFIASRFRPAARFNVQDVTSVLRLASPMLGANLLAYLSRNLDNLLIGLFVGARPLGFYATAYQVIQIPEYVLGASARTTALPAIVQANTREERSAAYFASLGLLAALATPIAIGCCLESDALVRFVLGPRWMSSAPLVSILAPVGLIYSCLQLNTAALSGLGDTRRQITSSLLTSAGGIAGILAGLNWGVSGVAIGFVAGTILAAGPNFFCVLQAFGASVTRLARVFVYPLASGAVMVAAIHWWQGFAAVPTSPFPQLLGAGVLGLAAYVISWMAFEIVTIDL
jgi:PST family polysaccharide transporter